MTAPILFTGYRGQRGVIAHASGVLDVRTPETEILLDNGQTLRVPTSQLRRNTDGSYSLRDEFAVAAIEERLDIQRRVVTTGTVRIHKTVHEREEIVDEPLRTETFEVNRVPVNRPVDGPVAVRQEGDTTVYPVVEEVLVVTKQLILREELHITRRIAEVHEPQRIQLRSEEIAVERVPGETPSSREETNSSR